MASIIVYVFEIIDVVDHNSVVVSFFKKIRHIKAFNPFRVEVVIDDFSLSYFVPG